MLISAAKDITSVQDILTGDTKDRNQTATTTLALIEQGMKVFTAIYKRIYRSLKQEFKLLYRLNAENLPEESYFTVLDEPQAIARKDYANDNYDVCPQADPRLVTDMQRLARAQALMATIEFNQGGTPEILRRYYTALGEEDVDKLLPQPPPPDPLMVQGAVAEVRKVESEAAKNETQAMKNVAEIEDREIDQSMEAMKMGEGKRQFDENLGAGERRAAEARQSEKAA
jgi:chaperonin GroES